MIKFIKNDYRSVKEALESRLKRRIPNWLFVIYYVLLFCIAVPLTPFVFIGAYLYAKILIIKFNRKLKNIEIEA